MKRYLYAAVAIALLMAIMTVAQGPAPASGVVLVQTLVPQVDVFLTASTTYTLTAQPTIGRGSFPMVYVNGLLMCSPYDYTLSGRTLTFTGQPVGDMGEGTIVQVLYWTVV